MANSAFHDVVFPARIAFGATVTTSRKVEVVALTSGKEQRNLRQAHSRHSYDAGTGVKSLNDLRIVMDFFEARRGPMTAFRFCDPIDHSSRGDGGTVTMSDQLLGTGNGSNTRFALVKTYGTGPDAYVRPVHYPVVASLSVSVNGALKAANTYSWDGETGEIVFLPGHVPANGQAVRAGFEFHVPVRFATEAISANISGFDAGDMPSIPLMEVL